MPRLFLKQCSTGAAGLWLRPNSDQTFRPQISSDFWSEFRFIILFLIFFGPEIICLSFSLHFGLCLVSWVVYEEKLVQWYVGSVEFSPVLRNSRAAAGFQIPQNKKSSKKKTQSTPWGLTRNPLKKLKRCPKYLKNCHLGPFLVVLEFFSRNLGSGPVEYLMGCFLEDFLAHGIWILVAGRLFLDFSGFKVAKFLWPKYSS